MASLNSLPVLRVLAAALPIALAVPTKRSVANDSPDASQANVTRRVITKMRDLWELPEKERANVFPLRMEIEARYYDPYWKLLWGSDGSVDAYFPLESASAKVRSGQRFRVEGSIVPARGLPLGSAQITILADSVAVRSLETSSRIGDSKHFDLRMVTVDGYVNRQSELDPEHVVLELAAEGRQISARVLVDGHQPVPQVEGAFVRLTCLYVATHDPAMPEPKVDLWVSSSSHVEVTGWLEADTRFGLPLTMIEELPSRGIDLIRVAGVVRSQSPGAEVVVRDETGQVALKTAMTRPVDVGVEIEAIGYPATEDGDRVLRQSLYRPTRRVVLPNRVERASPLLRLVDQVRALSVAEAGQKRKLRLSGIVTWSHPEARFFFLRDTSGGVRVNVPSEGLAIPAVGRRLMLEGTSAAGDFAPVVEAEAITISDFVPLPPARTVTFEHAMTGVEEGSWVSLGGYVRAAARKEHWDRLELTTAGGEFVAWLPRGDDGPGLMGSVVQLRGVCTAVANAKRQLTGIQLWVPRVADVTVEEHAPADSFKVPLRTIASLRQFSPLEAVHHRVRIAGTVVNQQPGVSVDLQEGTESLRVLSRSPELLTPGDRVEAVGFAGRQGSRVVLREAEWRRLAQQEELAPAALGQLEAIREEFDGRLVRIEGRLIDVGVQPTGCRLVCQSGNVIFEAMLNGPQTPLPAWRRGSSLALTGVYEIQVDAYGRPHALQLGLRSTRDVQVLRGAPWWTVERALAATVFLGVAILLGLGWVNVLRRRVARQTTLIREQVEKAARLETELERSSKLESLGVLAGGIAHDFNNLLTVVMGNLSLVLTGGRVDGDVRMLLREGERAAIRARDLTQQLLTFSKGGAPVRAAVRLTDVVREAAGFAQHGSTVRCEFDFASNLWAADVDKGQIAQVAHNVVINAIQAMPTGGVIKLGLHNETIQPGTPGLAPGRYIRLTIADNGVGIPSEHLSRIFDPYFTTKERGSGLGLATVYSIVKKHLGRIEVRSKPGEGTMFLIWLPAAESRPEEPAAAKPGAARWAGRVLVMDDEDPIRRFMTILLQRMGFQVTAVAEGESAVREFAAASAAGEPFCLAILDLTIPGAMGGVDALKGLQAVDPSVRAIVSSGYAKDPVVANYRAFGFSATMPKPYLVSDVTRVINEVMGTSAAC